MVFMLYSFGAMGVEMTMEHEGVKKLMESGEKFDVCVLEIFNTDAAIVSFFYLISNMIEHFLGSC